MDDCWPQTNLSVLTLDCRGTMDPSREEESSLADHVQEAVPRTQLPGERRGGNGRLNIASSALEALDDDLGRRSRNGQLRSHQNTRSGRYMDMPRRRRRGDGKREERGEENVERRSKRPREEDGVSGNSGGDGSFGTGTTMLRGLAGPGPVAAPRRLQPPFHSRRRFIQFPPNNRTAHHGPPPSDNQSTAGFIRPAQTSLRPGSDWAGSDLALPEEPSIRFTCRSCSLIEPRPSPSSLQVSSFVHFHLLLRHVWILALGLMQPQTRLSALPVTATRNSGIFGCTGRHLSWRASLDQSQRLHPRIPRTNDKPTIFDFCQIAIRACRH
jgi:hypothetical protein